MDLFGNITPIYNKRNSRVPKPTPKDWERVNELWSTFLKAEKWILENYLTASFDQINRAKIKKEKYRVLIGKWNQYFRTKTNRNGRK